MEKLRDLHADAKCYFDHWIDRLVADSGDMEKSNEYISRDRDKIRGALQFAEAVGIIDSFFHHAYLNMVTEIETHVNGTAWRNEI